MLLGFYWMGGMNMLLILTNTVIIHAIPTALYMVHVEVK